MLGTAYLIAWIGFKSEYIHTVIFLHILLALEFIWLVTLVNKTNRMLDRFFSSVHETGTSIGFENLPDDSSFKKLSGKLNGITEIIRASRIEKENEHHYLKYLVEHLKTGIITIENDRIDLINNAGLELLGSKKLKKTEDLKQFGKKFFDTILNIRAGDNRLTQAIVNKEIVDFTIRASEFVLLKRKIKLISFQDIHKELDQKEIDAWQKVIKVLAHEILSSISPIHSLSSHLNELLKKDPEKYITDTKEGLEIIHQRSNGLMGFVSIYRELSDLPKPVLNKNSINGIIKEIAVLCESEFNLTSILEIQYLKEDINIISDKNLVIQSSLNIIRNAIQAVQNISDPKIIIQGLKINNKVTIKFIDNGTGIEKEDMSNIFIPFFTTKKSGSGIGLTIAKQLITSQGGLLEVQSEKNNLPAGKAGGTTVLIKFESTSTP